MTEPRRALVTGGAKGIGLAIARRLAQDGVTLALLGRDRAALQTASRELGAAYEVADVTQPAKFTAAIARLGPCGILVNNAGAASSQPFLKSGPDDWAAMVAVNLTSAFIACHAVCPGFTDTDLVYRASQTIALQTGRSEADATAALTQCNPQGRLVTPQEVAEAVAFLCRDAASAMTGQSIVVAGGEVP
jgi:NAD(P)-dependent dehydrogenase (short-subunit alcohol dehydrogenase family)